MVKESFVLALQFGASLFMASDYFFDERQRGVINTWLQKRLKNLHVAADHSIEQKGRAIKQIIVPFMLAVGAIPLSWFGLSALSELAEHMHLPVWVLMLGVIACCLASFGLIWFITNRVLGDMLPMASVWLSRLGIKFMLRCPKGTIFSIGFILLMVSFVCRYLNLK